MCADQTMLDKAIQGTGSHAPEDPVHDSAVGCDEERLRRVVDSVADRDPLTRVEHRRPRGTCLSFECRRVRRRVAEDDTQNCDSLAGGMAVRELDELR